MENIIEEIRQYQLNLLKEEEKIDKNYNNNYYMPSNKGNILNLNSNKSQKLNSYSAYSLKYKPIFNKRKEIQNKKPKKHYETFIVENNNDISSSELLNIIKETQSKKSKEQRNTNEILFNKNKALLWYEILTSYDSYNKENEKQSIKENKSIKNNKENKLYKELVKMHESIIKQREMNSNKKIEIRNYKDILNIIIKEIEAVRKERKKENDIFQKRIEILETNMINNNNKLLRYKTPKKEIKKLSSIYLSHKVKENNNNYYNKFNSVKEDKKYKTRFNFLKKNKYNLNNNNIHQEIKYILYNSNNSKKYINKYLRSKSRGKNKKNKNNKKKHIFGFYEKTMNEIKKLNKENELIEKKYKNMPLSKEQLNDILIKKINKINKTKIKKEINYKNKKFLIKKDIKLISNKIIDDLLYECVYDLMQIEGKQSDKDNKAKLISGINVIYQNLNNIIIQEKNIVSKYNNIIYKNESKSFNYNIIPISKKKLELKIDNDLINKIEEDKLKILDNMILNGSFYSDFNIFEIYDEFVNEQIKVILEDEINYIVNKYELFVDKLLNEELKKAENDFNK